jgi:phosphate uptake regulator
MRRKLVKQGVATLMISLPSKWAKANKLDKGDEVELEEKDNSLVIRKEVNTKTIKEITLDINEDNIQNLRILLTHSYRKGFDRIILQGKIQGITAEITKICSNVLLGFEVTEKFKEKIILEKISQPDNTKYDSILSKVFLIISEMPNYSDIRNIEELKNSKDQCDRFVLFCRRMLNQGLEGKDPLLEWEFLTFLTHIQHTYYYLLEYIIKNKAELDKQLSYLLIESRDYFKLLEQAYLTKNIDFINKLNSQKNKYAFGKCLDLIQKSKGKETIAASYLREIFRLIQIASSPLLAEILDKKN